MALGDPYVTIAQLKYRAGVPVSSTVDDDAMTNAALAASRAVERVTRRQFNRSDVAVARSFVPPAFKDGAWVADFWTDEGLIVATDDDGTGAYGTTWSASDFQLEPLDGIVDETPDWPYWVIRPRTGSARFWPHNCHQTDARLRITAKWGWAEVPADVVEATLIVAAELWKLKDAPLGVAGLADFGVLRVRENPMAAAKLAPYVKEAVLVA